MSIRVSAVQFTFSYASKPQEFFDRVYGPIERATQEGAQLVALPNYAGFMLLGISIPLGEGSLLLGDISRAQGYTTVAEMLLAVAPSIHEFYLKLFSSLAAQFKIFIVAGTVIERSGDALFNTAYLFAPDGAVIGSQRQTHRAGREIAWGLSQGDDLSVFDIGCARVGLVVGADIEYPEVSRILALQNANLLIHPAAYPLWHDQYFLLDLWREVQSNQVFGLQACTIGKDFKGKSSVYMPIEMTGNHRGVLAQSSSADEEEIVVATLDFEALQHVIDDHPIFESFNYDLYAREFPDVYEESRKRDPGNAVGRVPLFPF
ncbi:MAG TPA: nitrilase-related carbon-nitrogen hydrolase [Anaerolineae bacterium]